MRMRDEEGATRRNNATTDSNLNGGGFKLGHDRVATKSTLPQRRA